MENFQLLISTGRVVIDAYLAPRINGLEQKR